MTKSPEEQYLELIQKGSGAEVSAQLAEQLFDQLQPISPSFLIGEWTGGYLNTGHPGGEDLKKMKWAGKVFRTIEDVDPIIVYNEQGERIWLETYGHARIREVVHRGVLSAAMIYDDYPIIDYFRFVDENTVAGVLDDKTSSPKEDGIFYFHLTRIRNV